MLLQTSFIGKEARVFHDISVRKPTMGDAGVRKVLRANVVTCHYHFGFPSLFRFRRCAGLQTAMRHVEDLANFPDIILDPAKDGIYISVDRSHT